MDTISAQTAGLPAPGNKTNIISRREIVPLLARALETVRFYSTAVGCPTALIDRTGRVVGREELSVSSGGLRKAGKEFIPESGNEKRFCDFCGKYYRNPSRIREGGEYSCVKTHLDALSESRHSAKPYIYACAAGFVFWTSPLFRNGRYAGALTSGRVLARGKTAGSGRKAADKKFRTLCKDKAAAEIFRVMLDDIQEKSHNEIQAMAHLQGSCAGRVSEKEDGSLKKIRRMTREGGGSKKTQGTPADLRKKEAAESGETGADYPMERERMLLAAFRRGDNETGGKILKDLMNRIIAAVPGNFEIVRFRAVELAVLLSRAAVTPETTDTGDLLEVNNRHLRRIQESGTEEELIENMNLIAGQMAGKIFSFKGKRHASVLRKAERYIWKNYTRKLSLKDIAKASGLSAPYFSSVFKEEMSENLSNYLNRLRVGRAAALLTETRKPLNEIAVLCGFEDQSWFSKIFKKFTGTSPGRYRESSGRFPEYKEIP